MDKIKVAKELMKLAKNLIALDEEGDGSGFQPYHDYENAEQTKLDLAQKQGKKYVLIRKERGLWRIQACKNFGRVKKGDLGGLIESEKNLSHDGNCWVSDKAMVCRNAKVYDNALVYGSSIVDGDAQVYGNAHVYNWAHVSDDAKIYGNAHVYGGVQILENAKVYDTAQVYDDAQVSGNAQVYDHAHVYGKAVVNYRAKVHGNAKVDYDVDMQEITE